MPQSLSRCCRRLLVLPALLGGMTTAAADLPPRELQAMVRDELVPYLNRRFGTRLPGCSLMLRFVGIGQSGIDQTLEEHVPVPTPQVGS